MSIIQSTLYVLTQGAYVRRDHLSFVVEVDKKEALRVPVHHVESVAVFGNVMVSPGAMALACENGASVSFLTESGRMMARVDAPCGGNVLVRREQYRRADSQEHVVNYAARFVAGKLQNSRNILLRAARESSEQADTDALQTAANEIALAISQLPEAKSGDEVRGHEGNGARAYYGVLSKAIKPARREGFSMEKRTRRPPLDPLNCILSFFYAMLTHDCASAASAAGLDPSVGYLHTDRPGRPSFALDLMEEFRPLLADRLALAVINRQQIAASDFTVREGGAVELKDEARRKLVGAWQERKRETITHPFLECETRHGLLPLLQARLFARHLRGDCPEYVPCVPK